MELRDFRATVVSGSAMRQFVSERPRRRKILPYPFELLLPPPLHRRADADRLAIFRDRAAGEVEALFAQQVHQRVVRKDVLAGSSASISVWIWALTASAETTPSPSAEATPEVKKYLSSNVPRSQLRYLFEVTRLTVDFVHLDRIGHRAQGQRAQFRNAAAEEAFLLLHDFGRDLEDRLLPLVERLDQPVGVGQLLAQPRLSRLCPGSRRAVPR